MTQITADLVRTLRERSGAGMLDCKKSLVEAQGDIDAAIAWLRKKGLSVAAKKAGRAAAEGLVGVHVTDHSGAMVEVNSETDFVARNETFQNFVRQTAELASQVAGDVEKLKQATIASSKRSVADEANHLIATIGENILLRRSAAISVEQGAVVNYLHNSIAADVGRIGVLIALESTGDKAKLNEVGRLIAMHIAAAHPQALSIEDLDTHLLENEREVLTEQAKASGRPDEIIAKMVEGRLRKFYEQVVLLEQIYVVDNERKISQVLADFAKDIGAPIAIKGFVRFGLGEGLEKKSTDFAAEVASQLSS